MVEIKDLAQAQEGIQECSILSVLDVRGKYCVAMKCIVDNKLSLEEAHSISTALENKIMVVFPRIKEANIHAEPSKD